MTQASISCKDSEEQYAKYVQNKCSKKLEPKQARTLIGHLRTNGWSFREIYHLGKYNPLMYGEIRKLLEIHDQLLAAGICLNLIKRILISRVLLKISDAARIIASVRHYKKRYGIGQEGLVILSHRKPRILLLWPDQIDECWHASQKNGTDFYYYLRKRTTASAQGPDLLDSFPRQYRPRTQLQPSI